MLSKARTGRYVWWYSLFVFIYLFYFTFSFFVLLFFFSLTCFFLEIMVGWLRWWCWLGIYGSNQCLYINAQDRLGGEVNVQHKIYLLCKKRLILYFKLRHRYLIGIDIRDTIMYWQDISRYISKQWYQADKIWIRKDYYVMYRLIY